MSKLFEKLVALEEEIKYQMMISTLDCIWYFTSDSIHWNFDDNVNDLINQEGMTFGGEYYEGYHKQDGCYFFNYDNGCGETTTAIFLESKLVELIDE